MSNKYKVFITTANLVDMENVAHSAYFTEVEGLSPQPTVTKITLASRLTAVRNQSTRLVAHLSPEDCQIQCLHDASPSTEHLAQAAWFLRLLF